MAAILDVSEAMIDKKYRKLAPEQAIKTVRKQVWLHARTVIDAWMKEQQEAAAEKAHPKEPDPMLIGGTGASTWGEEYRKEQTLIARMERLEREKTHANLNELDAALNRFGGQIRRFGEILQRKYGGDAADALNEALDLALNEWQRNPRADDSRPDRSDLQPGDLHGD